MRRQALILFFSLVSMPYAQQNGVGEFSHPTVDELHQKLNELVQRLTSEEAEKEKKRKAAGLEDDSDKKPKKPGLFTIILERGGRRLALDKDNPVILEEIVMTIVNGSITQIELKYEEAALRRQFIHRRSIKNNDIKKSNLGHMTISYQAEGDLPKSDVFVNMSTTDRAKLLSIYIDGLLRSIRDLDDRQLAAKKLSNKRMNSALNMGIRIN